jgi:glycosyltransferase involved in cell wall biosynthesis
LIADLWRQAPAAVSVVISTYNRCEKLPRALDALFEQRTNGVAWEAVIVDNNSTDDTRLVAESFIDRGDVKLSYVFEPRQGLSFGRNAGIAHSTAPLVAFTDDDIRPAPDWVARIKRCFDEHPKADFIGGRVLPRWRAEPPAWLTPDHWSPLALVDYGREEFVVDPKKPSCLVGANFAFRREVFNRLGLFSPDFQLVRDSIGSTEDYEMQVRVWRAGGQGLYAPDVVVVSDVDSERTTKAYHRKWYAGHARRSALMSLKERTSPEGWLILEQTRASKLFGVPGFVYVEMLRNIRRWMKAAMRREESSAFYHEICVRHTLYYIRHRYRQYAAERQHSGIAELVQFVRSVVRKRVNAQRVRSQPQG